MERNEFRILLLLFFNMLIFQLRSLRKFSGPEHPMPICKCSPSRKLSCSLLLDLLPGCLFINSVGCDINIINPAKNETCSIESNNIAVPFELLVRSYTSYDRLQQFPHFLFRFHF